MGKQWLVSAATAGIIAGSVFTAAAQDVTASINDGRVNHWDIGAPVAIYCEFENPDEDDPDYAEFESVVLWAQTYTDGSYTPVLEVSADDISAAINESAEDVLVASDWGYSLYVTEDDELHVTAPTDSEGKTYSFTWELGDQSC